MLEAMYSIMDLCVHFGKPAFIVFISSLYLYFGFSNKYFSIRIQFNTLWASDAECMSYSRP